MSNVQKVAFLGTGMMGAPMARNIHRSGIPVAAWNRTAEKARPLAAEGIRVATTPAEAVENADAIVTMLKDAPAIEAAIADIPRNTSGRTIWWLQMSTVGFRDIEHLQAIAIEKGLSLVDAPVQGTRQPAEAGQLVVMAAGSETARIPLAAILDAIGKETLWVATEPGLATRLKLALNSWVLALTHGTAESLSLAKGLGVDPALFLKAVSGGPLDCPFFQMKSRAMIAGDFTPAFTVENALKDSALILAAAQSSGVAVDLLEAGVRRYQRAKLRGHGQSDMAASYCA